MTTQQLDLSAKEKKLIASLKGLGRVIVAYSGGVDSSLLAYYARRCLGDDARIVIAVSPSLASDDLKLARRQAEMFDWNLTEIRTDEVEKEEYQSNDPLRCYHCKKTLFAELEQLASREKFNSIAYGANLEDLADFRPGHRAAKEFNVASPLTEAGLSKEEIRQLAKNAGLPSWDKPQAACLSSRFPTFVPVTVEGLSQVDRSEQVLHSFGFRQVRVRHHGELARIEIAGDEMDRLATQPELIRRIADQIKQTGYKYVCLDLEGYRQGSSNTFMD